jgi:hypothetical protein
MNQRNQTMINQMLGAITSFLMSLRLTRLEKRILQLEKLHTGEAPYFTAAHGFDLE